MQAEQVWDWGKEMSGLGIYTGHNGKATILGVIYGERTWNSYLMGDGENYVKLNA